MHFLHYDCFADTPSSKKAFWSYRQCCEITWAEGRVPSFASLAGLVQERIEQEYPHLFARKRVSPFNEGGANSGWWPWVAQLVPAPFSTRDRILARRVVPDHRLVLLAVEHVYRRQGYRHGDPVLLDDRTLDRVAAVFFLDAECCRELLGRAARLEKCLTMRSTFAGTSLTLLEPWTIERL
jgi:hypothetical protein